VEFYDKHNKNKNHNNNNNNSGGGSGGDLSIVIRTEFDQVQ
jgi:hypothetical protein